MKLDAADAEIIEIMIDCFNPFSGNDFCHNHFVLASLPVRQVLIDKIRNNGFRGLFSVFALVTLIWAVRCYGGPYEELWVQTEAGIPPRLCRLPPSSRLPVSHADGNVRQWRTMSRKTQDQPVFWR